MSTSRPEGGNPLYGLTIGSTVDATTGEFGASVIKANISQLIDQREETTSMTGQSSYVYNATLNQGALGVSGNFGVSGVSKLKSSLSGYAGKAVAASSKSVDVHYNVQVTAGMEYVDFDDLQVTDLILALKGGPQQTAADSLTAFLNLQAALNALATPECDLDCVLYRVIREPDNPSFKTAYALFRRWLASVDAFKHRFGDGVVVGIIWGGTGTVTTSIRRANDSTAWRYGGEGAFTFSGIGNSVSVKATYNGGQSVAKGDVIVSTSSFVTGSCVSGLVNDWLAKINNKSFEELANVHVMDQLPTITIENVKAPEIPEFRKPSEADPATRPKQERTIIDKIDQIKDLNGLQTLAKASAYEEAKKTNESLTLDQFLNGAVQKANIDGLNKLEQNARENDLRVLSDEKPNFSVDLLAVSNRVETPAPGASSAYVPLGVWIADWATLFPWLATGCFNSVVEDPVANEMLKRRMMIQDFLTLARIYRMAAQCRFAFFVSNVAEQISDSFANRFQALQNPGVDPNEAFIGLSPSAQTIYRKWDQLKFLRNCELGLGALLDGRSSITDKPGWPPEEASTRYEAGQCEFKAGADANYSAFASFQKLFPLIAPTGELYAFGPANQVLADAGRKWNDPSGAAGRQWFVFDTGKSRTPMTLEANTTEKILEHKGKNLKLYPIPFKAADGVQWMGESLSTNLSSMEGLKQQLADVKRELGELKTWTFSSEAWEKNYPNWTPQTFYAQRLIKPQYMGLIPERRNIFS